MKRRMVWICIPLLVALVTGTAFTQSAAGGRMPPQPVGKTHNVTIKTNVAGAVITIDGVVQNAKAQTVYPVSEGKHTFKVSAAGYEDFEQTISITYALTITANLKQLAVKIPDKMPPQAQGHKININSNVPHAVVSINNVMQGNAPVIVSLSPGKYILKVTAPGFQEYNTTITVNKPDTITAYLQPLTYVLSINSNVNGAQVYIDGNNAGKIPFNTAVAGGQHTVRVTAPGYLDYETTVNLNGNMNLAANLQAQTFTLSVNANIKGAQVYLNGQLAGNAPYNLSVIGGSYQIKVTAPGFIDYLAAVDVKENTIVSANLMPATASVTITIPTMYLDRNNKNALKAIEIYLDGKPQNGTAFQVIPGKHTIRLVSGGLAIEKEVIFEAGKDYILQPIMDLIAQ